MSYSKLTYNNCILSVLPDGTVYFVSHLGLISIEEKDLFKGIILKHSNPNDQEYQSIEEVLDYDFELDCKDLDLIPFNIYKCDIVVLNSSSFNGDTTEYDCDISVENTELIVFIK